MKRKNSCCVYTMKNLVFFILIVYYANANGELINLVERVACIANNVQYEKPEILNIDSLQTECTLNNINATQMEDVNITLVCRNSTSLLIDIIHQNNNTLNNEIDTIFNGDNKNVVSSNFYDLPKYIVKTYHGSNQILHNVIISNDSNIWIHNLSENTSYNVLVFILTADLILYPINNNLSIKTLEKNYILRPIIKSSIIFTNVQPNINGKSLDLLVKWKNEPDKVCNIEFLYHSTVVKADGDLVSIRINYPMSLDNIYLRNLSFSTEYAFKIVTCDDNQENANSKHLTWAYYTTPSCLKLLNYNLDKCAPEIPLDLNVIADYEADNIYNVNVTWKKPVKNPTYYIMVVSNIKYNISGDKQSFSIPNLHENITQFITVNLYAYSIGGISGTRRDFDIWPVYKSGVAKHINKIVVIGILIIILFGVIFIVICIRKRNAKLERQRDRHQYFMGLDKIDPGEPVPFEFNGEEWLFQINEFQKFVDDAIDQQNMEIESNLLQFIETIGQGAFGVVRKARLSSNNAIVAVKSLKDCPSLEDIREFYDEIQVMKSVPVHPNIVGIIGHCTKNVREMMLLIEYCEYGNLQLFLHAIYKELNKTKLINNNPLILRNSLERKLNIPKRNNCELNYDLSIHDKLSIKNKNINNNLPGYGFVSSDMSIENTNRNLMQQEISSIGNQNIVINKLYDEYGFNENERKENLSAMMNKNCICKNNNKIILNQNDDDCKNTINDVISHISNDCDCTTVLSSSPSLSSSSSASTTTTNNNIIMNNNFYNNSYGHFSSGNQPLSLLVENPCYTIINKEKENDDNEKWHENDMNLDEICSSDLLSFAEQIANGMKFLSFNKVVHRDLAARNILVCSNKTVKICDFGLSRDVYQDNVYTKISNGRLPIRWMAIESLLRSIYTTQSDVWSFGILLFELVTLGGMPYPSINNNEDLLENLKIGKRMERPVTCSHELYNIMMSCWHYEPNERPKFSEIQLKLKYLLNDIDKEHIILSNDLSGLDELHKKMFIDKNINEQKYNDNLINSDSSYLKPIDF